MLSVVGRLMLAVCCLASLGQTALADRRLALVIGNAKYVTASPLANPANDAPGIANQLRQLGFEVQLALDLDKATFEQKVRDFANSLDGASAAVFFYAGHGLQVDGRNYMVPVDAKLTDEANLPFELVALDVVMQRLAHNRITSIIFLDACRDNPLAGKLAQSLGARSAAVGQGLATVHGGVGTLISFSTQPGNVALDGDGQNSPFAAALLRHIPTPNTDVLTMMKQVRREVIDQTRQAQVPWDNSSLVDEFYFRVAKSDAKTDTKTDERTDRRQPDRGQRAKPELTKPDRTKPDRTREPDKVRNGRPPLHPCDTIAASSTDPERMAPGAGFGDLNGVEGVKACRAALAKYPNTPRFEFQLARSLQKVGSFTEAAPLYRTLVDRGYLAALTNYGWLLANGQGVGKNEGAAIRLYVLAAHQGDTFGMFNTAMAYDSGKGLPFNSVQAARWIYAALRLNHAYSIRQMSGEAAGWTREFRTELQRLLKQAGLYNGPLDGTFSPEIGRAVQKLATLTDAPNPGGDRPEKRFDPQSIPVNAPPPSPRP